MTDLSSLKLYATQEHDCSYIPGEQATTLFVDPAAEVEIDLYSQLSDYGFRRSGNHLYRPHCTQCQACIPLRIPVEQFKPNRSQKRCMKKNNDLDIQIADDIDTEIHYQLYENYIALRHADGDMYPPSKTQYTDFLQPFSKATRYIEFRTNDQLIGVAVSDHLHNGLSAIYTFFDPNESARALGVFAILHQIERAKSLGLEHVYLGYWIKQCQKMSYKSQYRPFQLLINSQWITIS